MPRIKKINFEAELAIIDEQIEKCELDLAELKEKRASILKLKEAAEMKMLYEYIRKTGKSVHEFIAEA